MKKDTQIMNKLMQRSQATNGNNTRSVVEMRLLNSWQCCEKKFDDGHPGVDRAYKLLIINIWLNLIQTGITKACCFHIKHYFRCWIDWHQIFILWCSDRGWNFLDVGTVPQSYITLVCVPFSHCILVLASTTCLLQLSPPPLGFSGFIMLFPFLGLVIQLYPTATGYLPWWQVVFFVDLSVQEHASLFILTQLPNHRIDHARHRHVVQYSR